MNAISFDQCLTHNELITKAFGMVRQGELGPYETFQLSVSFSGNPIQMVLRHQVNGRLRIANIDRKGLVAWDNNSFPWN